MYIGKIAVLFILVSIHVGLAQAPKADQIPQSWASVKSSGKGELSVIYYEQPNLIFRDEHGNIKGLCAELLADFVAHVQQKHKVDIRIRYVRKESIFQNFLVEVERIPNLLGVTNVTLTPERKTKFKFTPSFMSSWVVLVTRKDVPTLKRDAHSEVSQRLEGFRAEIIKGSNFVGYAAKVKENYLPKLQIKYSDSIDEIIRRVSTDAKLFTFLDITDFITAKNNNIPVKAHDLMFGEPEQFAFVMSKSSDWDGVWAEFLTPQYRNSPRYRTLLNTYFKTTILK